MMKGFLSHTMDDGMDPMDFEGIDPEEILETLGEQEKLVDGDFFNGFDNLFFFSK